MCVVNIIVTWCIVKPFLFEVKFILLGGQGLDNWPTPSSLPVSSGPLTPSGFRLLDHFGAALGTAVFFHTSFMYSSTWDFPVLMTNCHCSLKTQVKYDFLVSDRGTFGLTLHLVPVPPSAPPEMCCSHRSAHTIFKAEFVLFISLHF